MTKHNDNQDMNFTTSMLPVVEKPVFRMGIAGNYGIGSTDIAWAVQNFTAIRQGPLSPEELSWVREYGRLVKARKKLDYVR